MSWYRPAAAICGITAGIASLMSGGVDRNPAAYRFVTDMLLVAILLAVLSIMRER